MPRGKVFLKLLLVVCILLIVVGEIKAFEINSLIANYLRVPFIVEKVYFTFSRVTLKGVYLNWANNKISVKEINFSPNLFPFRIEKISIIEPQIYLKYSFPVRKWKKKNLLSSLPIYGNVEVYKGKVIIYTPSGEKLEEIFINSINGFVTSGKDFRFNGQVYMEKGGSLQFEGSGNLSSLRLLGKLYYKAISADILREFFSLPKELNITSGELEGLFNFTYSYDCWYFSGKSKLDNFSLKYRNEIWKQISGEVDINPFKFVFYNFSALPTDGGRVSFKGTFYPSSYPYLEISVSLSKIKPLKLLPPCKTFLNSASNISGKVNIRGRQKPLNWQGDFKLIASNTTLGIKNIEGSFLLEEKQVYFPAIKVVSNRGEVKGSGLVKKMFSKPEFFFWISGEDVFLINRFPKVKFLGFLTGNIKKLTGVANLELEEDKHIFALLNYSKKILKIEEFKATLEEANLIGKGKIDFRSSTSPQLEIFFKGENLRGRALERLLSLSFPFQFEINFLGLVKGPIALPLIAGEIIKGKLWYKDESFLINKSQVGIWNKILFFPQVKLSGSSGIYIGAGFIDFFSQQFQFEIKGKKVTLAFAKKWINADLKVPIRGLADTLFLYTGGAFMEPVVIGEAENLKASIYEGDVDIKSGIFYWKKPFLFVPPLEGVYKQGKDFLSFSTQIFLSSSTLYGEGDILLKEGLWKGIPLKMWQGKFFMNGLASYYGEITCEEIGGGKLHANGSFTSGTIQAEALIDDLNLDYISTFCPALFNSKGKILGGITIKGSFGKPLIDGRFLIPTGEINGILCKCKGEFSLIGSSLYLKDFLLLTEEDIYKIKGEIGLSPQIDLNLQGETSVKEINSLLLGFLPFRFPKEIFGSLVSSFHITGTPKNPIIKGQAKLNAGKLYRKELSLLFNFEANNSSFSFSSLTALIAGEGTLEGEGTYTFNSKVFKGNFLGEDIPFDIYPISSLPAGKGDFKLKLEGVYPSFLGEVTLTCKDFRYSGINLPEFSFNAIIKDKLIEFKKFPVDFKGDEYTISGWLEVVPPYRLEISLDGEDTSLENLLSLLPHSIPVYGGKLKVSSRLTDTINKPSLITEINIVNFYLMKNLIEELNAEISFNKDEIELKKIFIRTGDDILIASGKINSDKTISLLGEIRNIDLDLFSQLYTKGLPLKGNLNLDASLEGSLDSPRGLLTFWIEDASLAGLSVERVRSIVSFEGNKINVEEIQLVDGRDKIVIKGELPFYWQEKSLQTAPLNLSINGNLNQIIFENDDIKAKGNLALDLQVKGMLHSPRISGKVSIRDTEITSTFFTECSGVKFDLDFQGNKVCLKDGQGEMGGGGITFQGEGNWEKAFTFEGVAKLDEGIVSYTPLQLTSKLSSSLNLIYKEGNLILEGEGEIKDYTLELDKFINKISQKENTPKKKLGFNLLATSSSITKSLLNRAYLDYTIKIGPGVWIKLNNSHFSIYGGVNLQGNLSDIKAEGEIMAHQGKFYLSGLKFDIMRAQAVFRRSHGIVPELDIRATSVSGYRSGAEIVISGLANSLHTSVTATDAKTEEEALDVLFPLNLDKGINTKWLTSTALGVAKNAFTFNVLNPLEENFSRQLRLDTVSLELEPGKGLDFVLGKNITSSLNVSYHIHTYTISSEEELKQSFYRQKEDTVELNYRLSRWGYLSAGVDRAGNMTLELKGNWRF